MIPALPLAIKIGGPILGIGAIIGLIYLYNENLRKDGEARLAIEHLQQSEEQRIKEAARADEKEQSRLEYVEKAAKELEEANTRFLKTKQRTRQLEGKVKLLESRGPEVQYETVQVEIEKVVEKVVPCLVDDHQLERLNHDIRVFNDLVADYRDEGTGEASGELTLHAPDTLTCDQIPDLTSEVVGRLTNVSIKHRTLSDYVVDLYEKDLAAKQEDEED